MAATIGTPCKTCCCPLRSEIEAKRAEGYSYVKISAWLRTEGYDISSRSLNDHFLNHIEGAVKGDSRIEPEPDRVPERRERELSEALSEIGIHPHTPQETGLALMLQKSIWNQALSVIMEQKSYLKRQGGSPTHSIKGLLDLVKMFEIIQKSRFIKGTPESPLDLIKAIAEEDNREAVVEGLERLLSEMNSEN